ncbi:UPF0187-domain-containing protein [Saitoella complicata NRRL Y-17804]|uniref:Bestrophin homolog n=1 Tax=Saitoella complicata (strain BCRC 22490 / CBS 7301 / JCM 7358 / NBRC 10748 / NRRL Y-17804) TaxID=698492 RepID=A0A0E9ND38_SAICN|nr:UPF0187-domain-containing protein [Saitoella complicata NRRL Y-17804]ODQ51573.1 UPF0187-domain-containing protein [Saitoella complicata NRRL Y-17804]GAO47325.1 hypothetical protein G7K_1533-t1 [Saitoella complicata NRRL Y-17804]
MGRLRSRSRVPSAASWWPHILNIGKASVFRRVWMNVLLQSVFAFTVAYVDIVVDYNLGAPNAIVPLLSAVVGLLLVFRNGSSFESFREGRALFQNLTSAVRNCARMVHISIPESSAEDRLEKQRAIKLMISFAYSVKHHLRRQFGVRKDFAHLLPPGYNPSERYSTARYTADMQWNEESRWAEGGQGYLPNGVALSMGLPLEITFVLATYNQECKTRGLIDSPTTITMKGYIAGMTASFGSLERVKATPIPLCHHIHEKQTLLLYCCSLPFTLVNDMGWYMILVVAMVSFTLYGIEGIGQEMEDPFGDDYNDINMDELISNMHRELMYCIENIPTAADGRILLNGVRTRSSSNATIRSSQLQMPSASGLLSGSASERRHANDSSGREEGEEQEPLIPV